MRLMYKMENKIEHCVPYALTLSATYWYKKYLDDNI